MKTLACIFFLVLVCSWKTNGESLKGGRKSSELKAKPKHQGNQWKQKKIPPLKTIINEDEIDYEIAFALASAATASLRQQKNQNSNAKEVFLSMENQQAIVSSIKYGTGIQIQDNVHRIRDPSIKQTLDLTERILRCEIATLKHHISKCRKRIEITNVQRQRRKLPNNALGKLTAHNAFVRKIQAPAVTTGLKKKGGNMMANATVPRNYYTARDISGVDCTAPVGCGLCVGGVLQSPNYPGGYGKNLACNYSIEVPVGSRIKLTFQLFKVEQDYDFLSIFDGMGNRIRGPITGYSSQPDFISKTNYLSIVFTADSDNMAVPEGVTPLWLLSIDVIQLPVPTTTTTTQSTTTTAEATTTTAESTTTTAEPTTTTAEATTTTAESTTTTAESTTTAEPTTTTESTTTTAESTTTTAESTTSTAEATTTTDESSTTTAESTTTTAESSTTTAESTTTTEPITTTAESTTTTAESTTTTAESTTTTAEATTTTEESTTTTTEESTTTTEESTTTTPEPIVVTCVDASLPDRCSIKLSCVNVTNNEGYIQSSNFPDSYEDSSDCITIITVPEGARMDIEFVHFMVEQDYDILKVSFFDSELDESGVFRETTDLTGYDIPDSIHIKSHQAKIEFNTDSNNEYLDWDTEGYGVGAWLIRFTVVYPDTSTTTEVSTTEQSVDETTISVVQSTTTAPGDLGYSITEECGMRFEDLTQSGGTLRSLNYPNNYPNKQYCLLAIDVKERTRIGVTFTAHFLELYYDLIILLDDIEEIRSLTTGYTIPEDVAIKSTKLKILFYSDVDNSQLPSNITGRWELKFTIGN